MHGPASSLLLASSLQDDSAVAEAAPNSTHRQAVLHAYAAAACLGEATIVRVSEGDDEMVVVEGTDKDD